MIMTRSAAPRRARRGPALAAALLAGLGLAGPARAQLDPKFDYHKLVTPPLHHIEMIKPERFVLANGMVVFLVESHELPVVTGQAYVRTTPTWIPDAKVGLGSITGQVMRSGGSAAHPGDALDDRLAAIGASIGTSIGVDLADANFRCLTENFDEVLGLFAEVLRAPAFPDDKIELARVGLRRSIASRNDEMIPLLVRVAGQAVYGKDSPYARTPEYATIEAVRREDCVQLHRQVFDPARMVLAIYGDFATADLKKKLAARFGDWKGSGGPAPVLPPPPAARSARLVFAPKEDVTQSGMVVTGIGFRSDDPDYPAMDVYQTALGGGFQSRLVNRIRTERGLAYGTGARAGDDYQRPGVFLAYCLTRSDSTMVALDLLREEVRKSTEAPFTNEELTRAKESAQNQFVFNFERPTDVLARAAFFEAVGYPQDFLQRYQQGLESVTAATVLEAAKRKVHPDQLAAVIVGKEKDFDRGLATAGLPLERVDISIPGPPSKLNVGAASPEAKTQGRQWLARAAELSGGSAAWAGVKSVTLEEDQEITMQGQAVGIKSVTRWRLPDHRRIVRTLPMGEMIEATDGSAGWMAAMGQSQDQPAAVDNAKQSWERSLFHLFAHPDAVEIQALAEPRSADGVTYRSAFVKSDVVKDWTIDFAPDGRIARMEYEARTQTGPARALVTFAEWKPEGALQYPHDAHVTLDGKPFMAGKVTAIRFNEVFPDSLFRKANP